MASSSSAAVAADPPSTPPSASAAAGTHLCPACGIRRPAHHFWLRNNRSGGNASFARNCATCRGALAARLREREADKSSPNPQTGGDNPPIQVLDLASDASDSDFVPSPSDAGSHTSHDRDDRQLVAQVLRDILHRGKEAQLQDEAEWILTGMGVTLYFFGWLSIATLFVVILAF